MYREVLKSPFSRRLLKLFLLLALLLAGAIDARADAIDGSWCYKGRHLAIEGPNIVVPSGKQITGDYDRHGFQYIVPPGDNGAGDRIIMYILDDETMELRVGSIEATPEIWRRCAAPVS